jgi:hypothetical protein
MKPSHRILLASLFACASGGFPVRQLPAQEPAAGVCQLRVTTEPPGATVQVDGKMHDVTPVVIPDLKPGDHLVSVAKAGFVELRKTVSLGVDQRQALDLKLVPLTGLVLVLSDPTGAEVRIDDVDKGTTPRLLTDLPMGAHKVRISAPTYLPKIVDVELKDRTPVKVNVALVSDAASLVLSSEPAGAKVTVNGIASGNTPCTVERIPGGVAFVEIELAGYGTQKQEVKLRPGQKEEMSFTLKPIPAGLQVVSIPPGARIYVENQFRGNAPVTLTDLQPGSYRVRAEMEGYETTARTITLERASKVTEEFRLEGNAGILALVTEPAGVRLFIDGKESGVTPKPPEGSDAVSVPLTVPALPPGTHNLLLTKEGFFSKELKVDIKKAETTTVHEKLLRRFIPNTEIQTTSGLIERGVLIECDPAGNTKLEIRPGVFKAFPARDIRVRRPIKE